MGIVLRMIAVIGFLFCKSDQTGNPKILLHNLCAYLEQFVIYYFIKI